MSQPVQASSSSSSASQVTQSSQSSTQAPQSASSTAQSSYTGSSVNTSNGTLADSEKQAVLSQMQSRTGVPASTWDAIITRESNWQVDAANPSSTARGLFQQLYGGTGSAQSQIDNAVKLYHNAGDSMSPWALTNY